jgi:hypothetical protein
VHTGPDGREESLISTPLLMHFVSLLGGRELADVETLADLYDGVVKRHLERELREHAAHLGGALGNFRKTARTALTRTALAMLALGTTRLSPERVERLLSRPEAYRSAEKGWWPQGDFWLRGQPPYYTHPFTAEEIEALLRFTLLRSDGGQVGFLHDSLRYYFAGVDALRFHEGPDQPPREEDEALGDEWPRAVAERLRTDPERWEQAAEFLGGALTAGPARGLVAALCGPIPLRCCPCCSGGCCGGCGTATRFWTACGGPCRSSSSSCGRSRRPCCRTVPPTCWRQAGSDGPPARRLRKS